jgi:hypothetical protein
MVLIKFHWRVCSHLHLLNLEYLDVFSFFQGKLVLFVVNSSGGRRQCRK